MNVKKYFYYIYKNKINKCMYIDICMGNLAPDLILSKTINFLSPDRFVLVKI